MTAKRFTHKMNQLGMQFICYDDKAELLGTFADNIGVTNIVKLLNELHEENESLKEENKFLRNKVATYKKGNALLKSTLDKEWK